MQWGGVLVRRHRLFNQTRGSGGTAMIPETRGNTVQTRNLDIGKQRRTAQCQRAEPVPVMRKTLDPHNMRVRRHRVLSSHAVCTRVSDTTLSSAAENHTKGESGTRDPLVLAPRSWSAPGTLCATLLGRGRAAPWRRHRDTQ